MTFRQPPASLDPLVAQASTLQAYGFPSPPQQGAELGRWRDAVGRLKRYVAPDSYVVVDPRVQMTLFNAYWSGWIATPPSGQVFNSVQGQYNEPSINVNSCDSSAAEGTWVGLGATRPNPSRRLEQRTEHQVSAIIRDGYSFYQI